MRKLALALLSAVLCAAALGAGAAPALPKDTAAASGRPAIVRIDARCGHGWHYVPAGYARRGKWRAAHCSPN